MLRTLIAAAGVALTLGVTANAALAEGDAANGEKWANRVCKACHTFDKGGKDMVGPNLWGVIGSTPGSNESFDRYQAVPLFPENGIETWTEENVAEYIADPEEFRHKYADSHESAMVVSLPPKFAPDVAAYLATLHD
ncbi:c-type cytochrome [Roseospira marina]|uniref:C-type cytochrome n=1 Tax=Roseospira marina TaxID=140057 RepID=A0A5M6IAJ5_9PROT|nr:c-type cytochrome [Roseospira marina]KAA5604745.1 c-type cytochrome [Roseospira marina]MBB4313421.1 cytochrome c [Roseospira marina]MBB5086583.1 cytochrome c [Roseospira marina]